MLKDDYDEEDYDEEYEGEYDEEYAEEPEQPAQSYEEYLESLKAKQSSIPQISNTNEPEKTSGSAQGETKKKRGNQKIDDDDDLFGIEERKREMEERKQREVNVLILWMSVIFSTLTSIFIH